jgi:hypothetical protein
MSDEPYTVRNRMLCCGGLVCAVLLPPGTACAGDADETLGPSTWQGSYKGSEYYDYPGYSSFGYLDPGYAFTLATMPGNPGYDVGGYGMRGYGRGGYGYPGFGVSDYGYSGYGYGLGASGYYASSCNDSDAARAADQRYIRQLEERIRELEKANQRSLPSCGERSGYSAFSPYPGNQPAHKTPWSWYTGQPANQSPWSQPEGYSEYPTYQPSYGVQPTYRFSQ